MPVDNWEDSSGHYIAETWRGQVLADLLDEVFANEDPGRYLDEHYPLRHHEIVTVPDKEPSKYMVFGICLGSAAIALATNYFLYSPLADAFKNLHF
jgi:hypothetical protein